MRETVDHIDLCLRGERERSCNGRSVGKIEFKEQVVAEVEVRRDGVGLRRTPSANDTVAAECPDVVGDIVEAAEVRHALTLEHAVDADGTFFLLAASVLVQKAQRATLGKGTPYRIDGGRAADRRLVYRRPTGEIGNLGANIGKRCGKSG